jgi:hypothetical protein
MGTREREHQPQRHTNIRTYSDRGRPHWTGCSLRRVESSTRPGSGQVNRSTSPGRRHRQIASGPLAPPFRRKRPHRGWWSVSLFSLLLSRARLDWISLAPVAAVAPFMPTPFPFPFPAQASHSRRTRFGPERVSAGNCTKAKGVVPGLDCLYKEMSESGMD